MKQFQIALTACLVAGAALAGVEEWTSIHPAGPASSIGGVVAGLGYAESGDAYLVSLLGKLHKRPAVDQPWVQIPVTIDGNPTLLSGLHVGPGDPPVLLGTIGLDRLARSADGGATWTELSLLSTGTGSAGYIRSFVTAGSDPALIYYNVTDSVFRSTDGGQNWEERTATAPWAGRDLQISPLSTSTLYLVSGEFFSSADGGQNWSSMSNGIPFADYMLTIGQDPTSLSTLYTGGGDKIYKSTDGAASWSLIHTGYEYEDILDIAVDPSDPAKVYAAADDSESGGIHYSSDGGVSWARDGAVGEWGAISHVDVSQSGEVMAGGNLGVKTSSDGVVFTVTNAGFNDFHAYDMAIAPGDEDFFYAVGFRGGVMASFDGGQTWSLRNDGLPPGQGLKIAVDPTDSLHVFYGDQNELYESADGGLNWQVVDLGGGLGSKGSVTIAPGDPDRLYVLDSGILLTSGDGGQTWTSVLPVDFSAYPVPVAIPHDAPLTVYVGLFGTGLLRSTDAGGSWSQFLGVPNFDTVNAIALDRNNPLRIVAGLGFNTVVESLDGGANWADISTNLPAGVFPISSVAIDNFTGDLYVVLARPEGVYKLNPDDDLWQELGDVAVQNSSQPMQVIPSRFTPGRLFLQAREMFKFDFDTDTDADGILDSADNCIDVANPDQRDTDGDQIGNLCDPDIAPATNDCQVNFLDLNIVKSNFLVSGDLDSDFDGDGQTNFADLSIMKDFFFSTPGPSGPVTCSPGAIPMV